MSDEANNNEHQPKVSRRLEKRKGLELLIYDLKQPKLIPIKLLTFIILSGVGVLLPFTTIHMKSLGMSFQEVGAIYGVSSVAAILSPFLLGLIADKLGNFKVMMSIVHASLGIVGLLFLTVPPSKVWHPYPENLTFALGCTDTNPLHLNSATLALADLDSNPCHVHSEMIREKLNNMSVALEECGYICYDNNRPSDVSNAELNEPTTETDPSLPKVAVKKVVLPKMEFRDAVFFPNYWSLDVTCSPTRNGDHICELNRKNGSEPIQVNATLGLDLTSSSVNTSGRFPVKWMTMEDGIYSGQKLSNFECGSYGEDQKFRQTVYFKDSNQADNDRAVYQFCRPQCVVRIRRSELCSNLALEEVFNPQLTFWLYMLFRFIFDVLLGGLDLFVGASVALVSELGGDYGFQRMFGYIGIAIFSPISGRLIDEFSPDLNVLGNTRPAFYLFAGLFGVAAIGMLTVHLDFKLPAKRLLKDVGSLLKNVELDMLLVVAFVSGICNGYGFYYLFLFLEEIGGTSSLMGLSNTFQCLSVIPLLVFSDRIFRKLSHPNVQVLCFAVNVIRLIGYSYLHDPQLCLFFESLDAISWNFARTSHVAYANQLGTTSTVASIQGLLGGITFGLGFGVGSFGGSLLIGAYGLRVTFRILGAISFITGFLYLLFNIFYLRRRNSETVNNMGADGVAVEPTVTSNGDRH